MTKIVQDVKQFLNDEEGVTAIEYGLIAALIGVAISITVGTLGGSLNSIFTNISNRLLAAI